MSLYPIDMSSTLDVYIQQRENAEVQPDQRKVIASCISYYAFHLFNPVRKVRANFSSSSFALLVAESFAMLRLTVDRTPHAVT